MIKNKCNIVTFGLHETRIIDYYVVYCIKIFVMDLEDSLRILQQGHSKLSAQVGFISKLLMIDCYGIAKSNIYTNFIIELWTTLLSMILDKYAPIRSIFGSQRI